MSSAEVRLLLMQDSERSCRNDSPFANKAESDAAGRKYQLDD
jgi:hypothetical protein